MDSITVNASDAAKRLTMTVHVKGLKALKVRAWIGTVVIRLGAWIVGVGSCTISEAESDPAR